MRSSLSLGSAAVVVVVFTLVPGYAPIQATDDEFAFPTGWSVDPYSAPQAVSPSVVATVLAAPAPATGSRLVQYRGLVGGAPSIVATDLPGRVFAVAISPSQNRILAHQTLPELPEYTFRISMIDANGTVLWTRNESRAYRFSTTGEVVSASGPVSESSAGSSLEVYNLDGSLRRQLHIADPASTSATDFLPINDVLLVGSGDRAIVASRKGLWCSSTVTPATTYWSLLRLGFNQPEVMQIRLLNSTTIATDETGRGQFRVVDVGSGAVRYRFDPDALLANDDGGGPDANWKYWGSYRPYSGAKPGSVVLFNKTSVAYRLNLASGQLTPFTANVAVPAGAVLRSFSGERVLLLTPTSVRLRSSGPVD